MKSYKELDAMLIKSKMFNQDERDAIKKYCQDEDGLNIGYVIAACFEIGRSLKGYDIYYLIQLSTISYARD